MPASRIYTSIIFCISAIAGHVGAAAGSGLPSDQPDVARNVVLVHGAFVDGSSWDRVIRLLQRKGFHVTAVQNPLTSLADTRVSDRDRAVSPETEEWMAKRIGATTIHVHASHHDRVTR